MFNGNDVTGKFPTKFFCEHKSAQIMYKDDDWCNIYHLCAGPRDNIFICPPGTIFNQQKQGCFDRYSQDACNGSSQYYKPNMRKPSGPIAPSGPGSAPSAPASSLTSLPSAPAAAASQYHHTNSLGPQQPHQPTTSVNEPYYYPFNNFNYNMNNMNFN